MIDLISHLIQDKTKSRHFVEFAALSHRERTRHDGKGKGEVGNDTGFPPHGKQTEKKGRHGDNGHHNGHFFLPFLFAPHRFFRINLLHGNVLCLLLRQLRGNWTGNHVAQRGGYGASALMASAIGTVHIYKGSRLHD